MQHDVLLADSLDQAQATTKPCGLAQDEVVHLVKEYHHHLVKFIYRRVQNLEHAQDIAQATYMEALRGAAGFKGQSKPKTWLFGIALNLSKNRQYYMPQHENIEEMHHLVHYSLNPEEHCMQQQSLSHMQARLGMLSIDLQKTAYLVLCLETPYETTAQLLNIPIGTVRSRVARVRQFLKQEDDQQQRSA